MKKLILLFQLVTFCNLFAQTATWDYPVLDSLSYSLRIPSPLTNTYLLGTDGIDLVWFAPSSGGLTYWTESQNTAAPNGTVNVTALSVTGGSTNNVAAIVPKGTGAFQLAVSDNTATGGNIRGANAVDLQTLRDFNTMVASGDYSTIGGGKSNKALGLYSCAPGGYNNYATGQRSFAAGYSNTAGGTHSVALGFQNSANGTGCFAMGANLTLSNQYNFGFMAIASSNDMTIATDNIATFANVDLWLANNDNTARGLKFFEAYNSSGTFPNTANFTKIVAGVQSADITYTLPTATPASNGYFLTATTGGTMSWTNTPPALSTLIMSGSINLNVSATKTANYTAGNSDCVIPGDATSGAITITLPPSPGTGQTIWITKIDAGINAVQIAPNTGQTIIGVVGNISLPAQGSSNIVVYAGSNNWLSR